MTSTAKHKKTTGHPDQRQDRFRHLPADYARAQHRNPGPPNAPALQDMTPADFAAIKGAGPRY